MLHINVYQYKLKLIHEVCPLRKASVTEVGWAKPSVHVILLNSAGDIYK